MDYLLSGFRMYTVVVKHAGLRRCTMCPEYNWLRFAIIE